MLQGKTVLLGVTGGIAAYKMPNVARMLKKLHANVHVLMTAILSFLSSMWRWPSRQTSCCWRLPRPM